MGSDNGMPGRRGANLLRLNKASALGACNSALGLLVTVVLIGSLISPGKPDKLHTFDPSDTSHLPKECLVSETGGSATKPTSALAQLAEVQSYSHDRALVIACHRIWCRSYGHCEPCSGIGDRTRFLLSLVTDALERKIPVEIDAPQPGLLIRSDAVYQSFYDKLRFFGRTRLSDWVHWRDYDVSSRYVSKDEWGVSMERTYVHMQPKEPKPYRLQKYDPCLFHALLRPDAELKKDIDRNLQKITTRRRLGVHLRVGDAAAFGIDNQDVRAVGRSGGLQAAVEQMMDCADDLATRIWNKDEEPVTYFFASDSAEAKALAGQILKARSGERKLAKFYTTEINPESFRGGADTDREAWLEAYLLSQMDGLVMNKTPSKENGYEGTAALTSTFAMLAQNIGFIPDENVKRCELR